MLFFVHAVSTGKKKLRHSGTVMLKTTPSLGFCLLKNCDTMLLEAAPSLIIVWASVKELQSRLVTAKFCTSGAEFS